MKDYNLNRFIIEQKRCFDRALSEIKAGRKQSCWMWYIFPQLRAFGQSSNAIYYGIADLEEAKEYMANSYLRDNLITISKALLSLECSDPFTVMGHPDNIKLCSCMTLFEIAASDVPEFGMVLNKFFNGKRDGRTIDFLSHGTKL